MTPTVNINVRFSCRFTGCGYITPGPSQAEAITQMAQHMHDNETHDSFMQRIVRDEIAGEFQIEVE